MPNGIMPYGLPRFHQRYSDFARASQKSERKNPNRGRVLKRIAFPQAAQIFYSVLDEFGILRLRKKVPTLQTLRTRLSFAK